MSNICLKVTTEKKWQTQKSLKSSKVQNVCPQVSFWGAQTHTDITEFSKFLL